MAFGFGASISGETVHSGTLKIRAESIGLDRVEAALGRLATDAPQALAAALYEEMEGIITDSKTIEPRVPVGSPPEDKHPGTLRNSGMASPPVIRGSVVTVEGGYGGPAIPYALAQHERLDYRHPHPGEAAKYLETHFLRRAVTMDSRIAGRLAPMLEGRRPSAVRPSAEPDQRAAGRLRAFTGSVRQARLKGWRTVGGDY